MHEPNCRNVNGKPNTDDNGNTTEWVFDVHGRKIEETKGINATNTPPDLEAATLYTSWNEDGAVDEVIKEDNVRLLHEYDDFHRLKHISVSDTYAANPIVC